MDPRCFVSILSYEAVNYALGFGGRQEELRANLSSQTLHFSCTKLAGCPLTLKTRRDNSLIFQSQGRLCGQTDGTGTGQVTVHC